MGAKFESRVLPCLLVGDMQRTLEFYIDVLGFTQTAYFPIESDPIRTEVRRENAAIVFYTESKHLFDDKPLCSGSFYIFPTDVDAIAERLRGRVPFLWGPEVSDVGVRELAIRDPNGYVLVFAERE
jgi:catechol 2,3-dioxygenase-like lactoylglutathione lyase family enzyme